MNYPTEGDTCIPDFNAGKPKVPNVIPGTKRYVCLDANGELTFETDDRINAFEYALRNFSSTLIDREFKPRTYTVTTFYSKEKTNGEV